MATNFMPKWVAPLLEIEAEARDFAEFSEKCQADCPTKTRFGGCDPMRCRPWSTNKKRG